MAALEALIADPRSLGTGEMSRIMRSHFQRLDQEEPRGLARLAQAHVRELGELVKQDAETVRQAAMYALGYCQDERAVRPLLWCLVNQRHWADHDFAYEALGRLGDVALPELLDAALRGSTDEAIQAVQAMGQSRGDALPFLRQVLAHRRPLPESFFAAYENLGDPRGLPEVIDALDDAELRQDAVFAALSMLEQADLSELPKAARRAWADALRAVVDGDDFDGRLLAVDCLGVLRDERHLGRLAEMAARGSDEEVEAAVRAIARYASPAARGVLLDLLGSDRVVTACHAAAEAADLDHLAPQELESAREVLLAAVLGDVDVDLRDQALERLARSPGAIARLLAATRQRPARRRAAEALVGISFLRSRPPEAYKRLLAKLDGPAARALERAWERKCKLLRRLGLPISRRS